MCVQVHACRPDDKLQSWFCPLGIGLSTMVGLACHVPVVPVYYRKESLESEVRAVSEYCFTLFTVT